MENLRTVPVMIEFTCFWITSKRKFLCAKWT